MQRLIGIVAMTEDRVIGLAGTLPWHLPDDLAFFKRTTSGHPIVMGRKTFDSIGRPLPKRKNIVLTRDRSWSHPGVLVIHEVSELAALTQDDDIVYVIGGAEIYQAFLPQTQELLITHVHADHVTGASLLKQALGSRIAIAAASGAAGGFFRSAGGKVDQRLRLHLARALGSSGVSERNPSGTIVQRLEPRQDRGAHP